VLRVKSLLSYGHKLGYMRFNAGVTIKVRPAMVTYVVEESVLPMPAGANRASRARPLFVSKNECAMGNCTSNEALAIQLHGASRAPSDRLMPKYIATTIVPTPSTKHAWHVAPEMSAMARRSRGEAKSVAYVCRKFVAFIQ